MATNRNRQVRAGVAAKRFVRNLVKVHGVQNGDIILIKKGAAPATKIGLETIAEHFSKSGREDCLLIIVDDLGDLSVINEAQMRELGWERVQEASSDVSGSQPASEETVVDNPA